MIQMNLSKKTDIYLQTEDEKKRSVLTCGAMRPQLQNKG